MGHAAGAVPLMETKNLKKYFKVREGQLHAVDDVNIVIPERKTLGVVGESGCGKSTLGRTILRLLDASGGEVLYKGDNILRYGGRKMKEMRRKMQIIFQDPYSSINPRMSVAEIIAEFMIVHSTYPDKRSAFQRAAELMDIVGLARRYANAYPHELDGGRRQRIGIARALSLDPEFIVCDEPVSALDVSIQAQILNLLQELQRTMKLTYLFVSHDLSVVKHISNRIAVMYLGKIVESSPSLELFSNTLHPYSQALLAAVPIPKLNRKRERIILTGGVPSPINPPSGCRFHTRCPWKMDICSREEPPLEDAGSGHFVACHKVK